MVKISIHGFEQETVCSLSGRETAEAVVVSFDDGTLSEAPLAMKSLLQLVRLKLGVGNSTKKPEPSPGAPESQPPSDVVMATPVLGEERE